MMQGRCSDGSHVEDSSPILGGGAAEWLLNNEWQIQRAIIDQRHTMIPTRRDPHHVGHGGGNNRLVSPGNDGPISLERQVMLFPSGNCDHIR